MDMPGIHPIVLVGINLGSIYVIMGLGLSLVFGVTKVLNYAQGAFFTWGAYITWLLIEGQFNLPYGLAIALTLVIMFFFGLGFERVIIYPLRRLKDWGWTAIIVTLGCALLLDNLALLIFGPRYKTLPPLVEGTFNLGGSMVLKHDVLVFVASIVIVIILTLFLSKTREGMSLRAVAQDIVGAKITGLRINWVYGLSFGLSAVLATIASICIAPRTLINPYVGWVVFIKAFVVMVAGGLGSFKGVLVAAFIMGMVEAVTTYNLGAVWGLPIFLAALTIVLVFRPSGLFGTGE